MSAFVKFNNFLTNLAHKKYDFSTDAFRVLLTNTLPDLTQTNKNTITEIAGVGGYTTGGIALTRSFSGTSGASYNLRLNDLVITASAPGMGPFRYAVLIDNTATGFELMGYIDKGISLSLLAGESVTLDFPTNLFVLA